MDKSIKLFVYSVGIFICFLYSSVIQERVVKSIYITSTEEQEEFKWYLSMVFFQCAVNYLYANLLSLTIMKQGENRTKTLYYWTCALTNLLGLVCSNMALQWVSYPTQVIGKSGKPIPVMILGVLLGKKSYPSYKFIFVFIIVFGVALFMWNTQEYEYRNGHRPAGGGSHMGELLIMLSLTMDGITAAIQERMRTEYMTKSLHMMASINKWSLIFLGVLLACKSEMIDFIGFVQRHPTIVWQVGSSSIANTQGQLFVFLMIEHFGTLPCSLVTTMRKFFTVITSVIVFRNRLSVRQWAATIIILTGLLLDAVWKDLHNEIIVKCFRKLTLKRTTEIDKAIQKDVWV